jgi:hypothetical protein
MSSSGITPSNTGPLIIRTYNNNSSKQSFVLGDYDIPVASNLVLITSTNGQLIPSNAPTISTATFSSIQISSLFDRSGDLGQPGEVLTTSGSTIYWAPDTSGSGYWTENFNNDIYNNNPSGRVGVNTSNPTNNLQVNGTFQVQSDSDLNPFLASNGNYLFIKPNQNGFVNMGAFNTGTGPKPLCLQLESNGAIGGNVGINISAPQFMLDVAGTAHTSGFLSTNTLNMNNGGINGVSTVSSYNGNLALNGNVSIINNDEITAYTNTSNGNYIYIDTYSSNLIRIGGYNKNALGPGLGAGKNISFFVSDVGAPVSESFLGIATSSPQCTLDVAGKSNTQQIVTSSLTTDIGASGNWSNYYGKYIFVSTTNTLTLPTSGVSDGSVLIFRNLDLTNSLTINNCFTGGSPIPSNGAASFIFTTLYGGSTWISM